MSSAMFQVARTQQLDGQGFRAHTTTATHVTVEA
jgi:hypothetical protein